jgi:hypothetical protein
LGGWTVEAGMSRGSWAIARPWCGGVLSPRAPLAVDADQGMWRLPWWSRALEPVGL